MTEQTNSLQFYENEAIKIIALLRLDQIELIKKNYPELRTIKDYTIGRSYGINLNEFCIASPFCDFEYPIRVISSHDYVLEVHLRKSNMNKIASCIWVN